MSEEQLGDTAKWRRLLEIMAQLRAPGGCPWDRAQDHQTLKRYFLEETYEEIGRASCRERV